MAPVYRAANQAIAASQEVLLIGISGLGHEEHKLDGFTDRHTVFLSNEDGEVSQTTLSAKYPSSRVVALGRYAAPLVESMRTRSAGL